MNRYLQLFFSFLKVGLFTFGGGYAMIPIIEKEVIDNRKWIEQKEFLDLLTLAQSAPGPISLNTAVFVGTNYMDIEVRLRLLQELYYLRF